MSLRPPQPSGKKCFVYCGDERCDCEASPKFRDWFMRKAQQEGDHEVGAGYELIDKVLQEKPAMQSVQIFGFTPSGPLPGETFVKYLMAFKLPDGNVEIRVRNNDGVDNVISIPVEEAMKLSLALGAAKFSHEIVAARAERDAQTNGPTDAQAPRATEGK